MFISNDILIQKVNQKEAISQNKDYPTWKT